MPLKGHLHHNSSYQRAKAAFEETAKQVAELRADIRGAPAQLERWQARLAELEPVLRQREAVWDRERRAVEAEDADAKVTEITKVAAQLDEAVTPENLATLVRLTAELRGVGRIGISAEAVSVQLSRLLRLDSAKGLPPISVATFQELIKGWLRPAPRADAA